MSLNMLGNFLMPRLVQWEQQIGRRLRLWIEAATDESVRDPSCVEQICQRGEASGALFGP